MPSQAQIQNTILTAGQQLAKLVLANTTAEMGGNFEVNWYPASRFYLNIKALTRQFNLGDYTSTGTQSVYNCLNSLLGYNLAAVVIDPNYQPPGGVVIISNNSAFGYVKSGNIPFSGSGPTSVSLANWQTLYAPLYGPNPSIEIFTEQDGIDQKDTQTAIILDYLVDGDESTPLQSISWSYPNAVTGYYTISGTIPASSSGSTGTSGGLRSILIPFGDANISTDGDGNFVYTNPLLIGKSGYFMDPTQLNQYLFDGLNFTSNPANGSFTIFNPPMFALVPDSYIIVFVQ